MACYFFDLHADGSAQWDHGGTHCTDRETVERRAREMLAQALLGRNGQGRGQSVEAAIVLCVHEEGTRGIVLTARARPGAEVELVWS